MILRIGVMQGLIGLRMNTPRLIGHQFQCFFSALFRLSHICSSEIYHAWPGCVEHLQTSLSFFPYHDKIPSQKQLQIEKISSASQQSAMVWKPWQWEPHCINGECGIYSSALLHSSMFAIPDPRQATHNGKIFQPHLL